MKKQNVFKLADLKDYTKHGNICLVYIRRLRRHLDEGQERILFTVASELFDGVLNYLIKAESACVESGDFIRTICVE